MFEIQGAKKATKTTRRDETIEITDEIVFQWVGEADMDALLFENQLPFNVKKNKENRDAEKTKGSIKQI